jgi:hypothetical protein
MSKAIVKNTGREVEVSKVLFEDRFVYIEYSNFGDIIYELDEIEIKNSL